MIVLDASAVVELVLNTNRGRRVAQRIASDEVSLHAPHLLDVEVAQAVRRYVLTREIEPERGRAAIAFLASLDVTRYAHDAFLPRIWELRHNLTAYDAAYVVLAEVLGCPLLTADRRLASGGPVEVRVEVVG